MHFFEIKTHQIGRTYSNPHFFILNKGKNSGKPLINPCPNCFVVISKTEEEKNSLFYLSKLLQMGGSYRSFLKGSVILFITINDCKNLLKKGLISSQKNKKEFEKFQNLTFLIEKKQKELECTLQKTALLKASFMKNCINLMQINVN